MYVLYIILLFQNKKKLFKKDEKDEKLFKK